MIRRALISVFDKQGIVEFAKSLMEFNVEIISTGGTAKLLKECGIKCKTVTEITGAPEMLNGRVKTLHPRIFAAILAKRNNPDHIKQLKKQVIEPIDMVVINLYPFEEIVKRAATSLDEALENIDIGGPAMIRAAAKNYPDVVVSTSPDQYDFIVGEMKQNANCVSIEARKRFAYEAFRCTTHYDWIIANYLNSTEVKEKFPDKITLNFKKIQDLRYGENPHQAAAFYRDIKSSNEAITGVKQLHGKKLSFNNIIDLDSVVKIVNSFAEPCSVIVKHSNPCGVAS